MIERVIARRRFVNPSRLALTFLGMEVEVEAAAVVGERHQAVTLNREVSGRARVARRRSVRADKSIYMVQPHAPQTRCVDEARFHAAVRRELVATINGRSMRAATRRVVKHLAEHVENRS